MLAIELWLGLSPASCCAPPWRGISPWVGRFALRTLFLASQVLCAQLLLSGEGDTLLSLQSLIGAVGMVAFTYVLPYVFAMILDREAMPRCRMVWAVVNIAIGLVGMMAGLVSSLIELMESSAGLFNGDCKLAWSYAPTSPDDPCYISGLPS